MATSDYADRPAQTSHLFTLRLWMEDTGEGQTDWRGKVQHVNSGAVRYFRDWPALEAFVEGLVRGIAAQEGHLNEVQERDRAPRAA